MNVIIWYNGVQGSYLILFSKRSCSSSQRDPQEQFRRIPKNSVIDSYPAISPFSKKREIAATKSVIYLRSTSTFHDDYIKVDAVKFSQVYMWRLSIENIYTSWVILVENLFLKKPCHCQLLGNSTFWTKHPLTPSIPELENHAGFTPDFVCSNSLHRCISWPFFTSACFIVLSFTKLRDASFEYQDIEWIITLSTYVSTVACETSLLVGGFSPTHLKNARQVGSFSQSFGMETTPKHQHNPQTHPPWRLGFAYDVEIHPNLMFLAAGTTSSTLQRSTSTGTPPAI